MTTADLLALIAIIVTVMGLLLTAIGVLVLLVIRNLSDRITELKTDTTADLNAVWMEINFLRQRPQTPLPSSQRRARTG